MNYMYNVTQHAGGQQSSACAQPLYRLTRDGIRHSLEVRGECHRSRQEEQQGHASDVVGDVICCHVLRWAHVMLGCFPKTTTPSLHTEIYLEITGEIQRLRRRDHDLQREER